MRILATFLLVSYHGIGATPVDGLQLDYPHPLRLWSDFLVDVRMPTFAFIAGWVYALRPATRQTLQSFFTGKLRRLIVPGVVSSVIFWVVAMTVLKNGMADDWDILNALTMSFVHYWFLQAIFILLMAIALIEGMWNRILGPVVLIGLATLILFTPRVAHEYIEIGGVKYLAPYFLFGILVSRHGAWFQTNRLRLLGVAVVAIGAATVMNILSYQENGFLNLNRNDLQSALMAFGSVTALYLLLPRISILAAFGSASFTIYLYHVFGTSGARRAADIVGIENTGLLFVSVLAVGFLLPLAMHAVLSRFNLTRAIFLGLQPARARATPKTAEA